MDDKTIGQGSKKQKLSGTLKTALAIFSLAGAVTVFILPHIAALSGQGPVPNFYQLALTGIVLILLTSLLLGLAAKKLGFNYAWFLLALGYNALIIVIKFILSPQSLYGQTIELSNFGVSFDPNNGMGYLFVGVAVSLIYIAVLGIIYAVFKKIFAARMGNLKSFWKPRKKTVIVLAIIGVLAGIVAPSVMSALTRAREATFLPGRRYFICSTFLRAALSRNWDFYYCRQLYRRYFLASARLARRTSKRSSFATARSWPVSSGWRYR